MNYYKKLPCNDYAEINTEILKYVTTVIDFDNLKSFWNPLSVFHFVRATPLFQTWLKTQKLHVQTLAVTVGIDINCCGPHTDTPPARFKLSWPILNSDTTFNRFFQIDKICKTQINEWGGKIYLDPSELKEVDRMRVDSPALIDAQQPHDVWFEPDSKFPRLVLQCQLMKEPEYL